MEPRKQTIGDVAGQWFAAFALSLPILFLLSLGLIFVGYQGEIDWGQTLLLTLVLSTARLLYMYDMNRITKS